MMAEFVMIRASHFMSVGGGEEGKVRDNMLFKDTPSMTYFFHPGPIFHHLAIMPSNYESISE
jgi:hypothetical protein